MRRETILIEEIVNNMRIKLDPLLHNKVRPLIGMHSSINIITSWIIDGSLHAADILTIWGMAGIGKTSLAKYIYELHFHVFERSSFIEDIGRRSMQQVNAFLDLQKNLLEDIQKRHLSKLHDVNLGTVNIEKTLLRKRTLLVLDGIDNFEQLDLLVGTIGFHPGSKIIKTTQDGSLTEKSGLFNMNVVPKHTKHLLEGLNEIESLQLLSQHAFKCNAPKKGYKEMSQKVVKHCGGHPLALKVLGSSLFNEDVSAWEDIVDLLKKELNADIQKVLRITYDSLRSENDKELFKHIACFFVGKDREFTEMILKECGFRTNFGLSKLINRCLITVGPRNELTMHQLLQDMGKDLVRQESPTKPWKRSRLWRHEESYDVLKQEKGTTKIQGLVLDIKMIENDTSHGTSTCLEDNFADDLHNKFGVFPLLHWFCKLLSKIWCLFAWFFQFCFSHGNKFEIKTNAFSKMDQLRMLQLNYVQLHGSYKYLPKGLRWLSMHGFPSSYIPLDLQMENMVVLDMSYSNLQKLWKKPKLLPSLKMLNVSFCKFVRIGDFSWLPELERLILAGCGSLIEVCESIGQCKKLVLLDLSYCIKLKRLPRSMGKLKKLRILSIDGCTNLCEFPREISDIESLQVLNASNISIHSQASTRAIVDVVPSSLKSFSVLFSHSLVRLSLRDSNFFDGSIPVDLRSLSELKVVHLCRTPITSLNVENLSRLEVLCMRSCHSLKSVSCIPSTIVYLDACDCPSLGKIKSHSVMQQKIKSLSSLSMTEIERMRKVESLAQVNEKVLRNLGWNDLEDVKNQEVHILDGFRWGKPTKLPVQMLYEFGVFSILFQGRKIPKWFSHRSKGSSISLIVPSSPNKLRGLNVGYVYAYSQHDVWNEEYRTKNQRWIHNAYFRALNVAEDEESIVCARHFMIAKNEMGVGDEITIDIQLHERNDASVTQCGISLVYDDGDN
ncbi:hypothetical protein OSB04_013242 [Centaurea solstitialis]|uniref:ADP-ribosyl cyclase/cyclic ADP-ribose hydrolase n=1 Tax=Centaurea solstitialis TaxID=347529 RepID=A0AA38TCW2_9ASTR|nr:hypothetical protein OSB04_013242 [Centaurea solstitialis]